MGAGATKPSPANACFDCRRKFNPIVRKRRVCMECKTMYCQDCLLTGGARTRVTSVSMSAIVKCQSCVLLMSDDPTYESLITLKVWHLKNFLCRKNVPNVETCREKRHLVELVLQNFGGSTYQRQEEEHQSRTVFLLSQNRVSPSDDADSRFEQRHANDEPPPSLDGEDNQDSVEPDSTGVEESEVKQHPNPNISKISLSEVENIEDIASLGVKQLKIILTNNFVDYRGCKEKHELVTKVKMLWESREANQRLYEKLISQTDTTDSTQKNPEEPELCKICMDSPIDCVLLECGHMVTCTKCGKQMNECPICRQYVIRAVHIFKA